MSNKGKIGSLIDIRLAVAEPEPLNKRICELRPEWKGASIIWYSPIKQTQYKEFVDESFWNGRFGPNESSFWEGFVEPSNINT